MSIKAQSIDDIQLFEAVTGTSFDDAEIEDIEKVLDNAKAEHESLLSVQSSDELKVNIYPYDFMDTFIFRFTKDGEELSGNIKPLLDAMFGASDEVNEYEPNTFAVVNEQFGDASELEQWLTANTPFTVNEVLEEEKVEEVSPYSNSSTVNINGVEVTLNELSEQEMLRRKWDAFASKYKEENRILVTVRNNKFHSVVTMKLINKFGSYDDGLWDIFSTSGNRTIANQVQDRLDDNDPTPVTYIIGIDNSVDDDKVNKFRRAVNKLKLTR